MILKISIIIATFFILTACASAPNDQMIDAHDDVYCKNLGLKIGTNGYAQCRLSVTKMRLDVEMQNREFRQQRLSQGLRMIAESQQTYPIPAPSPMNNLNCTSYRLGGVLQTNCN